MVGTRPHTVGLVRLLGPVLAVTEAGAVVSLPSRTQRRLVAILGLHSPHPVGTDELCSTLMMGPGALRNTVSRLRRSLGSALATDPIGYALDAPVDIRTFERAFLDTRATLGLADGDRLEQLDGALALWHGDALVEFAGESWAIAEIARLHELRATALDDRAEVLIRLGRAEEAVAALETQVDRMPLRDRSRGLLLRALAASGRQADALRAYQAYRRHLAEEVGTEPSVVVRDLERRIAGGWDGTDAHGRGDRALRPTSVAARVPLPAMLMEGATNPAEPGSAGPGGLRRGHEVVGRDAELAVLLADLDAASTTRSLHTVIVGGEPGIGKTTLISRFAALAHAEDDTVVVAGRCDEDGSVVLQPFRDALTALVAHTPIDLLVAHVDAFGTHVGRLAPNLPARVGRETTLEPTDVTTGRYLLFEAVADLLRRIAAGNRLVLVIDDLHWAESTTLLLLRHLHRTLSDTGALVVVSHRDSENDRTEPLRAALAVLERGRTHRVALAGLQADDFDALVGCIFVDHDPATASRAQAPRSVLAPAPLASVDEPAPGLLHQLFQATAGNPLYTLHLVRRIVESRVTVMGRSGLDLAQPLESVELPHSLRDVVWSRVAGLGEATATLLATASVLGREFDVPTLAAVARCGEDDAVDAIDAGSRAGLLVSPAGATSRLSSGRVCFAHALVGHTLYRELSPVRRQQLHRRAASVLEAGACDGAGNLAVALARHHGLAGDHARAVTWAVAAGDAAMESYAPAEAARWFAVALEHARASISDRRPTSSDGGSGEGSGEGSDETSVLDLTLRLGKAQRRAGMPDARATLLTAAHMARRSGALDVMIQATLANTRGFLMVADADLERLAVIEESLEALVAARGSNSMRAELLALLSQELIHTPQPERRIAAAEESLALALASHDRSLLPRVASGALNGLWQPGWGARRCDIARQAMAALDEADDPLLRFRICASAFNAGIQHGDHQLARASWQRASVIAAAHADPGVQWMLTLTSVFELTMSGELARAERAAETAYAMGEEAGESDAFLIFAAQLGVIRSLEGRNEELASIVEQAAMDSPQNLPLQLYWGCLSLDAGHLDVARQVLADGAKRDFAHIPFDFTWTSTVTSYAVLAGGLGDVTVAARLLELMEPFADEICFNGAACLGSMAAHVAVLATTVGRHDDSERYLLQALEIHRSFGWAFHEASALVGLARNRRALLGRLDDRARRWLDEASAIADSRGIVRVQTAVVALRSAAS